MSRSNPNSATQNPSQRWHEWKGGDGQLEWYDRETKKSVPVKLPFKFLVLDTLSTITGYSNKHGGIGSNEVRDVRTDPLLVKFFKAGNIANGLWSNIKEKVGYNDGKFTASVYIAYRENKDAPLQIGNIKMAGCALSPWFDFKKKHQAEINDKAVTMTAGEEVTVGTGKSAIVFTPPVFTVSEISAETNAEAVALDKELQEFLAGYLKRPVDEKMDQRSGHPAEDENQDYEEADHAAKRHPHPSDPDEADLAPSDNDW